MLYEVIRLNGLIIVIFIILYFAFRFLKAKDSQDNSGGYSRRPYNSGYPWNRVVPPEEDEPRDFEEDGGLGEEQEEEHCDEEGIEEEQEEEYCDEEGMEAGRGEEVEDIERMEAGRQDEFKVQVNSMTADAKVDFGTPEVPSPEVIGLRMPEPMSIPTTEIVVDSQVHVDTTLLPDKDKS